MHMYKAITIIGTLAIGSCNSQSVNNNLMTIDTSVSNPLICDPVAGICGIRENADNSGTASHSIEKPITIIYFTDPICSSCWGIEPQLRKLKLEYGNI